MLAARRPGSTYDLRAPRTPFRRECRSPTLFGGGKATIGSLTPGVLVWIRVRTCGLKGVMGAWSDPAQIRVV